MNYILLGIILILSGVIAYLAKEVYHLKRELDLYRQDDILREELQEK